MPKRTPPFALSGNSPEALSDASDTPRVSALLPVERLPRLVDSFLLAGDINQHSARTLGNRRDRLGRFVWWAQNVSPSPTISTYEIRAFLHYLTHGHKSEGGRWDGLSGNYANAKPVSSGTVKSYHSTLRTFFNWVVDEGEVSLSPMERVPPPVDRPDQVQPFTDDQLHAMLAAARRQGKSAKTRRSEVSRRDEAIFLLLLDSGLRASELCALTIADVDLMEGQVWVRRGKGDKGRAVPFSRETKRALYHYLNERETAPEEALFLSERGTGAGEGLTRGGLLKMVCRWGKAAGVDRERCCPHTFRHTFAVNFLRAGGNVFTLKEILGHTSLAIVNRYVALAQADITRQHAQYSPVNRLKAAQTQKRGKPRHG